MPNQPACLICKFPAVREFLNSRLGQGTTLKSVHAELRTKYNRDKFGYTTPMTLEHLKEHQKSHLNAAPTSARLPTFSGEASTTPSTPQTDVATAIQKEALQRLADGELRITAQHGLKAQEMIDKREALAQDRQMTVFLARMMTQQGTPKALIVGDDAIEGEYAEVPLED